MHLTWKSRRHFNPRSLAGTTKPVLRKESDIRYFNPRSLAGATKNLEKFKISSKFQSTLPCGSDAVPLHTLNAPRISIHAPLRERLKWSKRLPKPRPFQSTLPCGSDRWVPAEQQILLCISIHAPLRERLVMLVLVIIVLINFNPRSLAGATVLFLSSVFFVIISIHAPLRERRHRLLQHLFFGWISIHAPSRERLSAAIVIWLLWTEFQSTLPHGSDRNEHRGFTLQ